MANTGFKIVKYKDTNVYSPTYGQTKTEKVKDLEECPTQLPVWIETSRECEQKQYQPSGEYGNTGKSIVHEEDQNPTSSTYQKTRQRTVNDLINCPLPDTNPQWDEQSSECEQE